MEQDLTALTDRTMEGSTQWRDNLTREERMSLKKLEEDESIVIRFSDKGGLIVVMDVDPHREEAIHQLSDVCTYVKLRGIPLNNLEQSSQD